MECLENFLLRYEHSEREREKKTMDSLTEWMSFLTFLSLKGTMIFLLSWISIYSPRVFSLLWCRLEWVRMGTEWVGWRNTTYFFFFNFRSMIYLVLAVWLLCGFSKMSGTFLCKGRIARISSKLPLDSYMCD